MKTIVNKDPNEQLKFIKTTSKTLQTFKAKELLKFFIAELHERAEKILSEGLVDTQKRELGLQGDNIVLPNAMFTHPVEITNAGIAALMEAGHATKLNTEYTDIKSFRENRCVDESTAAMVSFIYHLTLKGTFSDLYQYQAKERLLCIDIGGGTTDITTAELENDGIWLGKIYNT